MRVCSVIYDRVFIYFLLHMFRTAESLAAQQMKNKQNGEKERKI